MGVIYSGNGVRRAYGIRDLHRLRGLGSWPRIAIDTYTKSLLHFDGSLGDEANKVWTAYGNAGVSDAQSKFGGYSCYFDGNQDYLTAEFTELAGYAGDVTIECWFKLAGTPTGTAYNTSYYIFSGGTLTANPGIDFAIGNTHIWFNQTDYVVRLLSGAWTPNLNWNHVAVTRYGNVWNLWLNGTSIASATSSISITSTLSTACIGRCEPPGGETGGSYNGYIDEFRVSKGIARWTADFTPPTEPY